MGRTNKMGNSKLGLFFTFKCLIERSCFDKAVIKSNLTAQTVHVFLESHLKCKNIQVMYSSSPYFKISILQVIHTQQGLSSQLSAYLISMWFCCPLLVQQQQTLHLPTFPPHLLYPPFLPSSPPLSVPLPCLLPSFVPASSALVFPPSLLASSRPVSFPPRRLPPPPSASLELLSRASLTCVILFARSFLSN